MIKGISCFCAAMHNVNKHIIRLLPLDSWRMLVAVMFCASFTRMS